jgi:hypothetical protein
MVFNGVREHQKIEAPGFLYRADVLGLIVWKEMPRAYRFTKTSIERLTREWMAVIERDFSHPCIVAWVPFSESWGVPDLPDSPTQRHYVQTLYHLTKTLDPTRPVVGNDGWESIATRHNWLYADRRPKFPIAAIRAAARTKHGKPPRQGGMARADHASAANAILNSGRRPSHPLRSLSTAIYPFQTA